MKGNQMSEKQKIIEEFLDSAGVRELIIIGMYDDCLFLPE
jgi:hypothetical protein